MTGLQNADEHDEHRVVGLLDAGGRRDAGGDHAALGRGEGAGELLRLQEGRRRRRTLRRHRQEEQAELEERPEKLKGKNKSSFLVCESTCSWLGLQYNIGHFKSSCEGFILRDSHSTLAMVSTGWQEYFGTRT